MTSCTCPSDGGSLQWPCPEHPPGYLPPLPGHPEPRTYLWSALERATIARWGVEVRRQALAEAAQAAGPDDSFRDQWFDAKSDAVRRIQALPGADAIPQR